MGGKSPPKDSYFEDFELGHEMTTQGRTVTGADIDAFAGLSGDRHPIHTDEAYASQQFYGRRVAHGLLGLSLATGLAMGLGILDRSIIAFRDLTYKFSNPIFIGDTIHAHLLINGLKPLPRLGGGLVKLTVKVYNQDDEVVQTGVWSFLSRSRASESGAER
ncbi:MAG: MaoC family dehydratase N-terminal domain-containing protein [Anaerolineae bacterium]|nr:MaoC family dehydratase N-terminal domain-containing protein [Anaerolineae bacterium]